MIDVIIPTYKPQKYLYECFLSLERQTIDKSKFIVYIVLNGSNSEYYLKVSKWLNDFSFKYELYFLEIGNVSIARNYGLENSSNNYICFIDDDDYLSDNYLLDLYSIVGKKTLAVANVYSFKKEITKFERYYSTFYKKFEVNVGLNKRQIYSTIWAKMIHRDMIKNKRFNPEIKQGEDALFMFSLTRDIELVKSTSVNCIYFRRIREGSVITKRYSRVIYLKNAVKQIISYFSIFVSSPLKYNFFLFCNRILAVIKLLFINLIR